MSRNTVRVGLALLIATGFSVPAFAGIASAQGRATKKPASRRIAQRTKASGNTTSQKSAKSRGKSRRSRRVTGQQAPTADRISEIQRALANDGSFAGEPTGKWDDSTVGALKRFQEAHGLTPTGKLDAHTLQQLGLGSQIAGVAPPMPPVSSSSLASSAASPTTPPPAPQTQPQP